jgi:hypothetical protein
MPSFYKVAIYRLVLVCDALIVLCDVHYGLWLYGGDAAGHYHLTKEGGLQFVPDPWGSGDWTQLGLFLVVTVGMLVLTVTLRRQLRAERRGTRPPPG